MSYQILGEACGGEDSIDSIGFGDFFSWIPGLVKGGVEGGLAIDKRISDDNARARAARSAAGDLASAQNADLAARNALSRSIFSAQVAKQAAAAADADPGNPNKDKAKAATADKAAEDDTKAKAALAAADAAGRAIDPALQPKRLAALAALVDAANDKFGKAKKAADAVKSDPKKYPAARALEQIANADAQASAEVQARAVGGGTPSASEATTTAPTASGSFLTRKVIGPIPGWGLLLGAGAAGLLLWSRR